MTAAKLRVKLNKSIRWDDWTSLYCLKMGLCCADHGIQLQYGAAVGPYQPVLAWLSLASLNRVVRLCCGVPVDAEKISVDTG